MSKSKVKSTGQKSWHKLTDSQAGAGWDVMLLENGEPLFSRRCADEGLARFVATSTKQGLLRIGWADAAGETAGAWRTNS